MGLNSTIFTNKRNTGKGTIKIGQEPKEQKVVYSTNSGSIPLKLEVQQH